MSLANTVQCALRADRLGVSIVTRDSNTVIAYNCEAICHAQIDDIIQKHPRTTVVVSATTSSTSGFIVIFTDEGQSDTVLTSEFFCILVCSILCAVALSVIS